jgi:hypothetical protein
MNAIQGQKLMLTLTAVVYEAHLILFPVRNSPIQRDTFESEAYNFPREGCF